MQEIPLNEIQDKRMVMLATYQFWKEKRSRYSPWQQTQLEKYERTGPQEFVEFPYQEVTIPNIVKACNKHFEKIKT